MSAEAGATPSFGAPDERSHDVGPASPAVLWAASELPATVVVQQAQAGDEAAFAELYRAFHPRLLRYLRVLARDDAEDIAAETWLQVCRDLARFRGDSAGLLGWIITVGRNRAIDHFRYGNRRPSDPVPTENLIPLPGPDDTESQALTGISTEDAVALIATLPPDQAEAVMLRAVIGLDAKTAGKVLGKRPGAVRAAAHRGLKTLAGRVGDSR